jgi:hypothetical protein
VATCAGASRATGPLLQTTVMFITGGVAFLFLVVVGVVLSRCGRRGPRTYFEEHHDEAVHDVMGEDMVGVQDRMSSLRLHDRCGRLGNDSDGEMPLTLCGDRMSRWMEDPSPCLTAEEEAECNRLIAFL